MRWSRSMARTTHGFTLIETIITIVVIAIAAASFAVPFMTSLGGSPKAALTQQALSLAQGESDQLIADKKANGFGSIPTGNSGCVLPMPGGFNCNRNICYVPVTNLNSAGACAVVTNFQRATITITQAVAGTVTAVTLLTNHP